MGEAQIHQDHPMKYCKAQGHMVMSEEVYHRHPNHTHIIYWCCQCHHTGFKRMI